MVVLQRIVAVAYPLEIIRMEIILMEIVRMEIVLMEIVRMEIVMADYSWDIDHMETAAAIHP